MTNQKIYLLISIAINIVLLYILLRPVQQKTENEQYLLDRIKVDVINKKKALKSDSVFIENKIKQKNFKIYNLKKQLKDEQLKYESEIQKYKYITSDSAFIGILDSIQKVCCPGHSR